MIKRRFYKFEHGDKDSASDSSSSSSDSELEVKASEESESESESEKEVASQVKQDDQDCSASSGYESEDNSANEDGVDSAGLVDDDETEDDKQIFINNKLPTNHGAQLRWENVHTLNKEEPLPDDFPSCVLKCKSVFKCKLCPRIVCLNEETVRAHINSKRHARSKKLLEEGRLKTMLNSDGEIENQETAAETHAPVDAVAQDKQKMKGRGRQRRVIGSKRKRMREESTKNGSKRRSKKED